MSEMQTNAARAMASVVTYRFTQRESRLVVQAFAEGLLSAFGHNPKLTVSDFSGEIRLNAEDLESSVLHALINSNSLVVANNIREKDRREIERTMKDEVLETARFPDIYFRSTSVSATKIDSGVYALKVTGKLSLHGVTREHVVIARVHLLETGVQAEGETTLRQSDFDIRRVSVAAGTLKVKDEVKLTFMVSAR